MSHSVLPPIRDILPGYLNEYPSSSNSPSPPSSSMYLPQARQSPRLPPLDTVHCRSPSENSLFPQKSRNRSPRSISSFIPTPSFQFNTSLGTQSPTSSTTTVVDVQPKRLHTPSEDGSATSDQSITVAHQSESDDDGHDHQVPPKKRRREEKKHACPYCKKLFHRPVSLGVHINTHTGEKPYTCPFPNCSRQFNVNSNMRRHYRTHFTPGTIDISQLSYSAADERFYVHAIAPTAATIGRGRYGPVAPYIPPMPSASYGISHLKSASYSGPNSPPTANRANPYAVLPVSYVPIMYNNRPMLAAVDIEYATQHRQPLQRGDPHMSAFTEGRERRDQQGQEPLRSVGRLKPASDWDRGGRRVEEDDEDESDSDN